MRFRLRDVLIATALLAVYLTVFRYMQEIAAGESDFARYSILEHALILLFTMVATLWWMRKKQIRNISTLIFETESIWHWTPKRFVQACLPAVFSLVFFFVSTRKHVYVGCFIGSSVALAFICASMFFAIKVGAKGVVHGIQLVPWAEIKAIRDKGTIVTRLRVGSEVTLDVPIEHQAQITELYDQSHSEPRP